MEEKVWVVLYLEGKRGSMLWTTTTISKTVLRQILTETHAAFFTIRGISVTQSLTLKLESLLLAFWLNLFKQKENLFFVNLFGYLFFV